MRKPEETLKKIYEIFWDFKIPTNHLTLLINKKKIMRHRLYFVVTVDSKVNRKKNKR